MRIISCLMLAVCLSCSRQVESQEKVVLITGCSRGIGLATAEHLAKEGYIVYATARNIDPLPSSSHSALHFRSLDVTDPSTISKVVTEIVEKEGHLDILINNAGYALAGSLESLSMDEIVDQMDVNFFGAIRACHEVLPLMRKQKSGHIINISSIQGIYGLPYGSLYTASKAALESLSEALSLEVMPWNIFVSIVEPGFVATKFSVTLGTRKLEHNPYQKIDEAIALSLQEERAPSEFCQSPEEVAHFLQKVIEDKEPQLRYQTSQIAEETVSIKLKDLSGKDYLEWMKPQISESYKEAWTSD